MSIILQLGRIGHQKGDSDELHIQKSFLVYLATFMSVGGIVWGGISLSYGLSFQAIFPLSYVAISVLNMIYFSYSKKIRVVRFIQVLISLSLPFMFQWSLGGFNASGTIMLWAILALIASLTFQSTGTATGWLAVYLLLTVISAIFDSQLKVYKPEILPDNSIVFVVINLTLISTIVFGLVVYFVNKFKEAETRLEKERNSLRQTNFQLKKSYNVLRKSYNQIKNSQKQRPQSDAVNNESVDQENHLKELEEILRSQKKIIDKFKV
jgi:sigma-B regulation protein RsbU (phosphoserine phosphatase)